MAQKTLSIRVSDEDYRFLSSLAKEEKRKLSKTVRNLVGLGRTMLAIETYKRSKTSIERAARMAGVSISEMMELLKEHGVEANIEYEDYLKSLKNLKKIW